MDEASKYDGDKTFYGVEMNNNNIGEENNNKNNENSKSQKDSSNGKEFNEYSKEIFSLLENQKGESGFSNDNSEQPSNDQLNDYNNLFSPFNGYHYENNPWSNPKIKNNDNNNKTIKNRQESSNEKINKYETNTLTYSTNFIPNSTIKKIQSLPFSLKQKKINRKDVSQINQKDNYILSQSINNNFNIKKTINLNNLTIKKKSTLLERIREQKDECLSKNKSKNSNTNSSSSKEINNTNGKGNPLEENLNNEHKKEDNKYIKGKIKNQPYNEMNKNFINQAHYYSNSNYCINPIISRNRNNNNYYESYTGPDKFNTNSNFKNNYSSSFSNNSLATPISRNGNIEYQRIQNTFIFPNLLFMNNTLSNESRNTNYRINSFNNMQNSKYSYLSTGPNSNRKQKYDTLNSNDSGNSINFLNKFQIYPSRNYGDKSSLKKSNTSIHNNNFMKELKELTIEDMKTICLGNDERTTLMIKNLPNKIKISDLKKVLKQFKGEYNYLYLPPGDDKPTCNNKGYAFINFTNPLHILKFFDFFNEKTWINLMSSKESKLGYAKHQGIEELKKLANTYKGGRKPEFYETDKKSKEIEIPYKYFDLLKKRFPNMKYNIIEKTNTFFISSFN